MPYKFNPFTGGKDYYEINTGAPGPTGEQGPPGIQGLPGDKGFPGDQGPTGYQGSPGDKGLTGERGLPGTPGIDGNPGTDGQPGLSGDKGLIGDRGPIGDKGPDGNKGLPGDKGLIGDDGAKGLDGDKGLSGDKGLPGDPGENGTPGATGDKGLTGDKGPTGDPGPDQFIARLVLASDKPTGANVTPVTLGLSFNYEINSKYVIDMYMIVSPAVAGTGCGFLIDVSTAVTYVGTFSAHQLAITGTLSGGGSIGDLGVTSQGVSSGMVGTGSNFVYGSGILITGANTGTATFYFRSETTAVTTCKAGSMIRVMKLD